MGRVISRSIRPATATFRKIFDSGDNPFHWAPHRSWSRRDQMWLQTKNCGACPGCIPDADPRKDFKHKFDKWHKLGSGRSNWPNKRAPRPNPYILYWRTHKDLYEKSFGGNR